MMTIKEYFNNILTMKGYEAWEEATDELIALVMAEEEAWENDEECEVVAEWANAHNIDLSAGYEVMGTFYTYFQNWKWDFFA